MNRVHNTVQGWGGQGLNANNAKHSYTCSKCHTVHNSRLPRLMVTNCLDYSHRGGVAVGGWPASGSGSGWGTYGSGGGSGKFPAGGSGSNGTKSGFGSGVACHDNTNADGWPDNQKWNEKTPWAPPALSSPTATAIGSTTATLGASVTSNGGSAITARGTVWGPSANPTGNSLAEGGTTTGVYSHARMGLAAGTKIYYRGYATNGTGTGYSPDGSFYTEPSTQASGVNFTSVTSSGMTVNWTRGNGDGVIVLLRQGAAVNSDPSDGTYTGYTANTVFGSGSQIGTGNYVVYRGTGTSATITGLISGMAYFAAVYEYKGTVDTSGVDQGTNYKSLPATGSWTTSVSAPIVTSPTATSITDAAATLGANITYNGGTAITARGTVWGTSANPTGNSLAEGGTTTGVFSQTRTGLTSGTKIYYRGYATNSAGTGYSPDGSFYTEPSQASGVSFTSVGTFGMTVNWTRGNGDGVIVLMRQGSAVNSDPADGTYSGYAANSAFGSGSQIGTGNYVIYKGAGTSAAVMGLAGSTTYYVAVYEYKGNVDTSGVNQGTNYKSSPVTGSQATTALGNGSYSFTFDYTGAVQSLSIPAGATNTQFTVKGAGGGGGTEDMDYTQTNGVNGHLVITAYSEAGITLTIYVAGGGQGGSITYSGSAGGWGYHSGSNGGDGTAPSYDGDPYWSYGGAGGGGSSAILLGPAVLAEASGGAGGRSSDYEGIPGGAGGAGGGSDYPGTVDPIGGGAGGSAGYPPAAGGNGQIVITYEIP